MRLRNACGDRSDSYFRNQLHADPCARIRVFQVVYELGQILDRIDIVMRWGRNKSDARRRMTNARDDFIDFISGELAAFTWLRTLRHLDLQFIRTDEIFAGDAEARGRDLFNSARPGIAVWIRNISSRIFSPFSSIASAANAIHGYGQRLVRFLADRAERHGARRKTLHDRLCRLDFLEGNRLVRGFQIHQSPKRAKASAGGVDQVAVFLENFVVVATRRILKLVDRVGVVHVILAIVAPLVLSTPIDVGQPYRTIGKRAPVPLDRLSRDFIQPNTTDPRRCVCKVGVDEMLIQSHRFEDLRATIALQR